MFSERDRLNRIKDIKTRLEEAKHELEVAQRQGQYEHASRLRFSTIPDLERQLPAEGERADENADAPLAMLHDRVTSNDIARVVAKATGIPVQNLLKGERDKLVHVRSGDSLSHNHRCSLRCVGLDGRRAETACRWSRSCRHRNQRRGPYFSCWSASPYSARRVVLVSRPDGSWKGNRILLYVQIVLRHHCRLNSVKLLLDSCSTTNGEDCKHERHMCYI